MTRLWQVKRPTHHLLSTPRHSNASDGTRSSYSATARLIIDVVELDLTYTHPKSADWTFFAELTAAPSVDTTFLTVLKGLVKDSKILNDIPSFLDIPIKHSDTPSQGLALELWVANSSETDQNKKNVDYLNVIIMLTIGALQISFIQQKEKMAGSTKTPVKRLIHVSINNLPFGNLPKIPLIGQLSQPFDEIDYVWVHDDSTSTTPGLTRLELKSLNSLDKFPCLKFKDDFKTQSDSDVLLAAGSHLIIADTGNVILDYVFDKPKPTSPSISTDVVVKTKIAAVTPDDDPDPSEDQNDTSVAKLEKSQGPLSISNVGLKYSNSTIEFFFDAAVKLGPIEFTLLGFGFGIHFDDGFSLRNLTDISLAPPSLSVSPVDSMIRLLISQASSSTSQVRG